MSLDSDEEESSHIDISAGSESISDSDHEGNKLPSKPMDLKRRKSLKPDCLSEGDCEYSSIKNSFIEGVTVA